MTEQTEGVKPNNGPEDANAPTAKQRVRAHLADLEHAMKHNAPIDPAIVKGLKAILFPFERDETDAA